MKIAIPIYFSISLLISCQLNSQNIQRKDAAYAINLIDSLTSNLGYSANRLVAHFKSMDTELLNDNKIEKNTVDTLNLYYHELIVTYDKAIQNITEDKTIAKFKELQSNFLTLLKKGKEPWTVTVPVQIKMYREGFNSLNGEEQEIFKMKETYMINSATVVLELAKIVAKQESELENKFQLKLIDQKYM